MKHLRPRTERPLGQSMALLTDLMEHPLDAAYEDRATARRGRGQQSSTGTRSPLLLVTMIAVGLLVVVAAQTLRVPQDKATQQRTQIIEQITGGQRENDAAARRVADLRGQIDQAQKRAVAGSGDGLAQALSRAEVASGALPVSGPGITLRLDDSAGASAAGGADPRAAGGSSPTLTSTDLQVVVNGLWQAGAEAISINGQRLTSLSAIRFAGAAILVNFRPLSRPYTISAIGQQGTMWGHFRSGATGAYLESLKKQIKVDVAVKEVEVLRIPASDGVTLHRAQPAGASAGAVAGAPPATAREEEAP